MNSMIYVNNIRLSVRIFYALYWVGDKDSETVFVKLYISIRAVPLYMVFI